MRPSVHDPRCQFDPQTRAYAEYRVFVVLTSAPVSTSTVTVTLRRETDAARSDGQDVVCAIRLTTGNGRIVESTAAEHHPCAAIDRATELMLSELRGR